jgi:hypothetical protein
MVAGVEEAASLLLRLALAHVWEEGVAVGVSLVVRRHDHSGEYLLGRKKGEEEKNLERGPLD